MEHSTKISPCRHATVGPNAPHSQLDPNEDKIIDQYGRRWDVVAVGGTCHDEGEVAASLFSRAPNGQEHLHDGGDVMVVVGFQYIPQIPSRSYCVIHMTGISGNEPSTSSGVASV